jgi:hypothetical protein
MITFDNASILSYSHNPKFFGQDIFAYSIEKKISIEGYLLDLTNFSGVSGVFSGINKLKNLSKNSGEFYVNGEYFGTGYITNIQVDGEQDDPNWVRYANYKADLTVLSTGSLLNMTGSFYDIDTSKFNAQNLYRLNDFSETLSVNLNQEGIYEYDRNVSFEFENGLISPLVASDIAKNIASGILSSQVPYKILSQYGSSFLNGKKIYKESYDLVNSKFQFTETFNKSKSGDYADALYGYNISISDDGAVSVTENIKIQSLSTPIFEQAVTKLSSVKAGAYARCQAVYAYYYPLETANPLNTYSKENGYTVNKYNGEIEFQSIFSNEKFIENGYDWELILEAEDNPESMTRTTSLSVQGHGPKNSSTKWNNAKDGYSQKSSSIDSSAFGYLKIPLGKCRQGAPDFLSRETSDCSYYNGTISISKQYSDVNRQSITTTSSEESVKQWSYYPTPNGGVISIEHPQKTIGRSSTATKYFRPNMTLTVPPLPPTANELTESSSRTYDYFNRTEEEKITNYTH